MLDSLLISSFASELKPGVFLYLQSEKRFIYAHIVKRIEDHIAVVFIHEEDLEGNVMVDVFDLDKDAIVDYYDPRTINYN